MEVKNQNIICNKNGRNLAQFEFLTTQNAIQEIRKNTKYFEVYFRLHSSKTNFKCNKIC